MIGQALRPDEIGAFIKARIMEFDCAPSFYEEGVVMQAGDGIARIHGLKSAFANELLEFEGGALGMALNLEENSVCAIVFNNGDFSVGEGCRVKAMRKTLEVPVGNSLLGRVVNALGSPVDGKGKIIDTSQFGKVERSAPSITSRAPVKTPLHTGVKAIDALVPIGRGQRELIIGDRKTGKTDLCISAILNQKGKGVNCVYVAIGQKASSVASVYKTLYDAGAMAYTVIVTASAADSAAMQYIAPYVGCAVAEGFMYNGCDALVVYDDLSKHAAAYRALSLLLRRPPGREAYPGDVFYLHARLLERAAQLSSASGGGSMTALPVIETLAGDISAYIPTNVISITDGQIFLDSEMFNKGIRPAINAGLSVSRVGGDAQRSGMKRLASPLRTELARFRELEAFSQFSQELDADTVKRLERGRAVAEIFRQPASAPLAEETQLILFHVIAAGILENVSTEIIMEFADELLRFLSTRHSEALTEIRRKGDLDNSARLIVGEAAAKILKKLGAI